ncbi:hypothetical protein C8Q80DRAFT_1268213 [Daedaleopsis nitida]|nr:hypothetical protein C8Q80DRAFT_1268213 [Daedaleopsis nitida]
MKAFAVFCFAVSLAGCLSGASAREIDAGRMALERRYTTPHSLGDNYVFDPRDGWQTVNTTNLDYKYTPPAKVDSGSDSDSDADDVEHAYSQDASSTQNHTLLPRAKKTSHSKPKKASEKKVGKTKSATDVLKGLGKIANSIKGIGKPEPVTITWYTGHDLLNPSCWSNPTWAPTDQSFAAALTMDGWSTKPRCFKFLELCHSPQKCVFARVVDSCAGCAKGSKHVDLTKAAFSSLADPDQGILTVQMREATDPLHVWFEELWGPKEGHH